MRPHLCAFAWSSLILTATLLSASPPASASSCTEPLVFACTFSCRAGWAIQVSVSGPVGSSGSAICGNTTVTCTVGLTSIFCSDSRTALATQYSGGCYVNTLGTVYVTCTGYGI